MKLLNCLLFTLLSPTCFASVADTISLNGTWKFKTDLYKQGNAEEWFKSSVEKERWENMEVPGNWDLHNEYTNYAGDAWYSYSFMAKESWKEKNVRLVFQSVYNDSEIWLNGIKIGENHFGFLEFYLDITKHLLLGKQNNIVLKVNNVYRMGAIWNWGGIRRPVWLEITHPIRINRLGITPTLDLATNTSSVDVNVDVSNQFAKDCQVNYSFDIYYQKQKIASSGIKQAGSAKSFSNLIFNASLNLTSKNTHPWHIDQPHLYKAQLNIYEDNKLLHSYSDHFGIRKIEVDGMKLKLNGEEIRPVGFNLIAEDRVTGNTLPFDRIKKMVDVMKEAGANMARLSHNSLPKEFLDYLDEKGIMIFEEVSLWGKDILVDPNHPKPKVWLEKLVDQEYNHPSIIGWSVGNEIGSTKSNPSAYAYIKGAIAQAKALDPTRLAVYVSNSVQSQPDDAAIFSDLIMLNGYGNWLDLAEKAHANVPNKPIFFAEFGENLNSEDPNLSILNVQKMLKPLQGKDYVIGASLWTLNDYRSNYSSSKKTWDTPASNNRPWGVLNSFLQKKQSYEAIRKAYLPFSLSNLTTVITKNKVSGSLVLKPNAKTAFPAYQLKNYRISVSTLRTDSLVNEGETLINLPTLSPGENASTYRFTRPISTSTKAIQLKFLDGQNYCRFDTLIFLSIPKIPILKLVNTSTNTARIIFEKSPTSSIYTVRYGINDLINESEATVNNFIDLTDLKEKATYRFVVIAHNNAGLASTAKFSFTLKENELPPIIWGVEPIKQGFAVAYSTDQLDYRFEIQYGKKPGSYEKTLTLNNRGSLQVPNLQSAQTYYFRMRRIMQWGFASEWTHELTVRTL